MAELPGHQPHEIWVQRADRRVQKRDLQASGEWDEGSVMSFVEELGDRIIDRMLEQAPEHRRHVVFCREISFVHAAEGAFPGVLWHELDVFEELDARFSDAGFVVTWSDFPHDYCYGVALIFTW